MLKLFATLLTLAIIFVLLSIAWAAIQSGDMFVLTQTAFELAK